MPLFCSCYTSEYQGLASRLIQSLNRFRLPYVVERFEDQGSWVLNTHYKPRFLLDQIRQTQRPIVWTDSDSIIRAYPALFMEVGADVALVALRNSYLSGTFYLDNNERIERFLEEWIKLTQEHQTVSDQQTFKRALDKYPTLEKLFLPQGYCKIFDSCQQGKVYIEHYQASRRYRQKG